MSTLPKQHCQECGKEIHGRSDKRFCNDTCRNNLNRKKRIAEQVIIPDIALEIIRIIKNNYRLLKSGGLESGITAFQPIKNLLERGFNPGFFTSIREEEGDVYHFCFECGFRISGENIFIIERKEQIRL